MNLSGPILISASSLASLVLIGGLLAAEFGLPHRAAFSPHCATFPQEQLHGVLSRAHLAPPLRGPARQIRFSSDGKSLLVQVESGIYILSRDPLEMRAWIYAPEILPARFSADSRTLVLATRNLEITWLSLADSRKIGKKILKTQDGCLASELSANGELAACLNPALVLEVYRTDTSEQILTERDMMPHRLTSVGIIPRNEGTAYAEPFGYGASDTLKPLADRELFGSQFLFSPDGHFLLLIDPHRSAECIDVAARRKIGCPAIVKNRPNAPICFASPNEIAVLDEHEPEKSQIIAFPGGQFVTKLHLAAHAAMNATQPKYLVVPDNNGEGKVRLFDRDAGREVTAQKVSQMDVLADTLVTYSREGELKLVRLGKDELEAKTILPPPLLPRLRTANVSPSLDSIILGVRGDAGLFGTATGARVMPFTRLRGAWFAGHDELYAATWRGDGSPAALQRVDPDRGTYADVWSPSLKSDPQFTILDTHFGGPVLFVHEQSSFYVSPRGLEYPGHKRASKLRALDLKSGRELWLKQWEGDPPVPYADPQGERVALGWRATMSGGQALAKRYAALKKQMDAVKLTIDDTVFEVLEASSGKAVGTSFVRVGWGSESFDSVFSLGDFLICVRDGARVTVYSLSTGEIHARLFGYNVSASAVTGLLAAADGNHLRLYDLKTGTKKDEYLFPDAPVYTHFSADGKRLLVLTAQQLVFVLDMTTFGSAAVGLQRNPYPH